MPDSSSDVLKTRGDNNDVKNHEAEAEEKMRKKYNVTVENSVRLSTKLGDDESKIGEAQSSGTFQSTKSFNRDIDLSISNDACKPSKSILTREPMLEESKINFIGDITDSGEVAHFVTGSSYKGSWDSLGMAGVGRYVMPNGTIYEGELRDGMFHGQGSLYWPKSHQRLDVVHLRGELQEYRYIFPDGLSYEDKDWSYCTFPDRRFYEEIKNGFRPGGKTLKTAKQQTKILPDGCYDTGDGVFNTKTLCVTSFDEPKKVLRIPTKQECEWIIQKCRRSSTEPTGYRPDLNENWSDTSLDIPYSLPMSKDSPDLWWKRLTTFAQCSNVMDEASEKDDVTGSSSTQEICVCEESVIPGESCYGIPVPFEMEGYGEAEIEMSSSCEQLSSAYEDSALEQLESSSESGRDPSKFANDNMPSQRKRTGENSISGEVEDDNTDRQENVKRLRRKENNESLGEEFEDKSVRNIQDKSADTEKSAEVIDDEIQSNERQKVKEEKTNQGRSQAEESDVFFNDEIESDDVENIVKEKTAEKNRKGGVEQPLDTIDRDVSKYDVDGNYSNGNSEKFIQDVSSENFDYVTTISRENVAAVTEPETSNDLRMESETLPKDDVTEILDETSTKMSPTQQSSKKDLSDDETSTSIDDEKIIGVLTKEKSDVPNSKQILKTSAVNILSDDMVKKELTDVELDNNLYSETDTRKKNIHVTEIPIDNAITTNDVLISEQQSKSQSESDSKSINESKESLKSLSKSSASSVKKAKHTPTSISEPITLRKEISQPTDLITDSQISESSQVISKKKSSTQVSSKKIVSEITVSLEDEVSSLDKTHPSLVSLIPPEEDEEIEMFDTRSSNAKLNTKLTDVKVWCLSGGGQDYGPQTKIKDLLFHPALTAPRSVGIEYVRKPCDARVCKPEPAAVQSTKSRCGKEYPFNIPAKPRQPNVNRNVSRKK